MTAKTGTPLRIATRLDGGAADYEVHAPADGTELVVCGDCGFTWDADHTVQDDAERVGYECPRCVLRLLVEARQRVIEETVRRGRHQISFAMKLDITRLRGVALAAVAYVAHFGGDTPGDRTRRKLLHAALQNAGFSVDVDAPRPPTPGDVAKALVDARVRYPADKDVLAVCAALQGLVGEEVPT